MGEQLAFSSGELPELFSMREECIKQAQHPPNLGGQKDTHHVRFVKAFGAELGSSESRISTSITQPMLAEAVRVAKYDGSLALGSVRASANWLVDMIETGRIKWNTGTLDLDRYPWTTDSEWQQFCQMLFDSPSLMEYVATNMMMYRNSTNEPSRVASLKLIAHTMLPEKIAASAPQFSVLDFGAAFNYGAVMLKSNLQLPRIAVDFTHGEDPDKPLWERRVNELLAKRVPLLRATGVDLLPLTDPEWRQWGQACCYFIEMRGEERKRQRRQLDEIRDTSPEIRYVAANVGHLDEEKPTEYNNYLRDLDVNNPYKMVAASTMMHMNGLKDQRKIFDEMVDRTEPGGLVVIADFVDQFDGEIDERRLSHPLDRATITTPTSKKFTYVTLVYDPEKPSEGLRLPWRWDNGRVGELQPTSYGWGVLRSAFREDEQ